MKLTRPTRALLIGASVLAALVYLAIVDLGLYAGTVHRGVNVQGLDVGGLTLPEAQARIGAQGTAMRRSPLVFTTQGYDCRLIPGRVGWRSNPSLTARRAMAVGRTGGLLRSIRERSRSWTTGVEVSWGDGPTPARVEAFAERCARRGADFGVRVDEERLAAEMRRVMDQWPRDQLHELPLAE